MPLDAAITSATAAGTSCRRPLSLHVCMPDGGMLSPPAEAGVRVMELLERFGLPIRNECRGHCVCDTCRAHIAPAWQDRMLPPSEDEVALLAGLGNRDEATRLICRLVMTPELDGLELELTWDALVPQTYWTAG